MLINSLFDQNPSKISKNDDVNNSRLSTSVIRHIEYELFTTYLELTITRFIQTLKITD
jgi:hypothetical protein